MAGQQRLHGQYFKVPSHLDAQWEDSEHSFFILSMHEFTIMLLITINNRREATSHRRIVALVFISPKHLQVPLPLISKKYPNQLMYVDHKKIQESWINVSCISDEQSRLCLLSFQECCVSKLETEYYVEAVLYARLLLIAQNCLTDQIHGWS